MNEQQKRQEIATAANIALLNYKSIKTSEVEEYKSLYNLALTYVKQLQDVFTFNTIDAEQYFNKNYNFTVYPEYINAFIDTVGNLVNESIEKARQAFERRSEITSLQDYFYSLGTNESYLFFYLFNVARFTNTVTSSTAYIQAVTSKYLNNNTNKFNTIRDNVIKLLGLMNTFKSNKLDYTLFSQSQLMVDYKYLGILQPFAEYSQVYNSGGFIWKPRALKLSKGDRTLTQKQSAVEILSIGPIHGIKGGKSGIYFNDTPFLDSTGQKLLSNVDVEVRNGYYLQAPPIVSSFASISEQVNQVINYGSRTSRTVNFGHCNHVQVVVGIPQIAKATADYKIYIQATNKTTGAALDEVLVDSASINGETTTEKEFVYTYRLGNDETYPITVSIERTNKQILDDNEKTNELRLNRISGLLTINQMYSGLAWAASSYNSKEYTSKPNTTFLVQGMLVQTPTNYDAFMHEYRGEWDGLFSLSWTNNPIWIAYYFLTDRTHGLGNVIHHNTIDKYSFYNAAKYCDEIVNGQPRWTFNGIINKRDEVIKIIENVLSMARANLVVNDNGNIKIVIEQPQDPVLMINNTYVTNGEFKYSGYSNRAIFKVVNGKWNNPANKYKEEVLKVTDITHASDYLSEKTVTLYGVTSKEQATRYLRFILAVNKYETKQVSFSSGLDMLAVQIGDVIQISDHHISGLNVNGRVRSVATITENQTTKYKLRLEDYTSKKLLGQTIKISLTAKSEKNASYNRFYIFENAQLLSDEGGFYVTIPTQEFDNETPQANMLYCIYSNEFEPELYRITDKDVDINNHVIQFSANAYSREKFAIADGLEEIESYEVLSKPTAPNLAVTNSISLRAQVQLLEKKLCLVVNWDQAATLSSVNYVLTYTDITTGQQLDRVTTQATSHVLELSQELDKHHISIELSVYLNRIISTNTTQSTTVAINFDTLIPNRPLFENVSIKKVNQEEENINLNMVLNPDSLENLENADGVFFLWSDVENLTSEAADTLKDLANEVLRWKTTTARVKENNLGIFLSSSNLDKLKAKTVHTTTLQGETTATRYTNIYMKTTPYGSFFSYPKNRKANNSGIYNLRMVTYSETIAPRLEFNSSDFSKFRLNFTTSSNNKSKLLNFVNNEASCILNYKKIDVIFKNDVVFSATNVDWFNLESLDFTVSNEKLRDLFSSTPRKWKIQVTPMFGDVVEIGSENASFYRYVENVNSVVHGSSAFIEVTPRGKANEYIDFIKFTNTGGGVENTPPAKKIVLTFNNETIEQERSNFLYAKNELAQGTYPYEVKCYSFADLYWSKSGNIVISSNPVDNNSDRTIYANVNLDDLRFWDNANAAAYRLGDVIRLHIPPERNTWSEAFPDNITMQEKESKGLLYGERFEVFTNQQSINRGFFAFQVRNNDELLKSAQTLRLTGQTLSGNYKQLIVSIDRIYNGLYFNRTHNLIYSNYYNATEEDKQELLSTVEKVEIVTGGQYRQLSKLIEVTTNAQGEGNVAVDFETNNILSTEIINAPEWVFTTTPIYNDGEENRSIKVFTRNEKGQPIAATVTIKVYYLG